MMQLDMSIDGIRQIHHQREAEKRPRCTYHALLNAGLEIWQDPNLLAVDKRFTASWKPRNR